MEKNMKKNIYIYIYLNHFAVLQKLTQHCKSMILLFKKKKNLAVPLQGCAQSQSPEEFQILASCRG